MSAHISSSRALRTLRCLLTGEEGGERPCVHEDAGREQSLAQEGRHGRGALEQEEGQRRAHHQPQRPAEHHLHTTHAEHKPVSSSEWEAARADGRGLSVWRLEVCKDRSEWVSEWVMRTG